MEDGLVHESRLYTRVLLGIVLILIVMEDGLVRTPPSEYGGSCRCLNPYCNGRWSRT